MGHIAIHAIGKAKAFVDFQALVSSYQKRLPWRVEIGEWEVKKQLPDALRVGAESELLLAACPPANYVIALDIKGKEITSEGFAELMAARMLYGQPVTFLIGGAHGFADSIRKRADLLISFGRCTWPHMLVRVMLMEQLYRAYSIQHNHPYHK